MNENMKKYLKFILKKDYRQYLYQKEQDGKIERKESTVKCSEKKVMILQRKNKEVGMFSDYIVFLRMIEDAIEKNFIPIIDRKTYKNLFFPASKEINTWECFFEQPMGYTLEDIDRKGMEVYINHIGTVVSPVSIMHCTDEEIIEYWRNFAKKYVRLRPEIYKSLLNYKTELFGNKRILGISIREGYIKLNEKEPGRLQGHPVQASITEILNIAEEYMVKWKCQYIFFSCQTEDTERKFIERFGEKAFCHKRLRPKYKDLIEGSELVNAFSYEEAYEHELDYITEIFLLSKCTSFICSENSGSEAAFLMSEGFENFMCIRKGLY